MQLSTRWSVSGWLASTTLATLAFWSLFGACVDASEAQDPGADSGQLSGADSGAHSGAPTSGSQAAGSPTSVARVIVAWDPRACGDPHRVIVELDDPGGGQPLATSVPCALGEAQLDAPHLGVYEGRAYAWSADATMRSMSPLVLTLDAPVTRWDVPTPR